MFPSTKPVHRNSSKKYVFNFFLILIATIILQCDLKLCFCWRGSLQKFNLIRVSTERLSQILINWTVEVPTNWLPFTPDWWCQKTNWPNSWQAAGPLFGCINIKIPQSKELEYKKGKQNVKRNIEVETSIQAREDPMGMHSVLSNWIFLH